MTNGNLVHEVNLHDGNNNENNDIHYKGYENIRGAGIMHMIK